MLSSPNAAFPSMKVRGRWELLVLKIRAGDAACDTGPCVVASPSIVGTSSPVLHWSVCDGHSSSINDGEVLAQKGIGAPLMDHFAFGLFATEISFCN